MCVPNEWKALDPHGGSLCHLPNKPDIKLFLLDIFCTFSAFRSMALFSIGIVGMGTVVFGTAVAGLAFGVTGNSAGESGSLSGGVKRAACSERGVKGSFGFE